MNRTPYFNEWPNGSELPQEADFSAWHGTGDGDFLNYYDRVKTSRVCLVPCQDLILGPLLLVRTLVGVLAQGREHHLKIDEMFTEDSADKT